MRYAQMGYRVVLITCTDGQLGLDDAGRPGSDGEHDDDATRARRASELQRAAILAGFERVVTLGYGDSGMRGWAQNDSRRAFMNANVEAVAHTLAAMLDELEATVVLTYDENGFYGHPDHIMANVVTRRALDLATRPERLYYPVVPAGILARFVTESGTQGVALPQWVLEAGRGIEDDSVTTSLDVRPFAERKRAAIAAHASQLDNADLVSMDDELFSLLFGTEYYQRAWSRRPAAHDADDLFGGLHE